MNCNDDLKKIPCTAKYIYILLDVCTVVYIFMQLFCVMRDNLFIAGFYFFLFVGLSFKFNSTCI